MRLTDLNPRWVGTGGEGVTDAQGNPVPWRDGVGIHFQCPCGCQSLCFVHFSNPLDGGPSASGAAPSWNRTGETFEELTLTLSILRIRGCENQWHGFITAGAIITC